MPRVQDELDTDELAALAEAVTQVSAEKQRVRSEDGCVLYILRRRAVEYYPFMLLCVFSVIVVLQGSWWGAVIGGGGTVVLLIRESRRIGRFSVDAGGVLLLTGRSIDWSDLAEIKYHYKCPWYATVLLREAWITASVSMVFVTDRKVLKLARGALWQVRPKREPLSLDRLSDILKRQARSAGLRIFEGREASWVARRP